jgi:asparagine synthase (glutamine-hydrolysing)
VSGVFGIVDPKQSSNVRGIANQMASTMSHREWFRAEDYFDEHNNLVIGRIGIGVFNRCSQPVVNKSRTKILVMAGEVYNRDSLATGLDDISDEEIVMTLFEDEGEAFISRLKGVFVMAIFDRNNKKLLVFNDRFGLYPIFYSCRAGRLVFAPEMKGIFCDEDFPRKIDLTALTQYVRFQHLLGVRTFFEDLQLLPPASMLKYDLATGSCSTQSYWSFNDIPSNPQISLDEAVEESSRLLKHAVTNLSNGDCRPGVYLSGGLDSRTILGMVDHRPVATLTYGMQNCRDVNYANRIAKIAGSDHHWVDLPNGDWVREFIDFHLELTEGYHSWIHAHGISTLPLAREVMDVNLTGWGGGTVMGKRFIEPRLTSAVDDFALTTYFFYKFNQKYTWPSITEAEERLLYQQPIGKHLQGLAYDSFREELEPYLDLRPDVKSEYFYLRNHEWRLTMNILTFTRSHIEVRIPFYDYDLFDFMHSLPVDLRKDQRIFRPVMQKMLPNLTYIPYEYDEFLPTTNSFIRNSHSTVVKMKRRFNRHFWKVFPEYYTLYADYQNYLRNDLRVWAENILYDKRTAAREIFDTAFLRTLMDRHLSKMEDATIGKLAPLITYEMMLRRYYD